MRSQGSGPNPVRLVSFQEEEETSEMKAYREKRKSYVRTQ